MWGTSSYKLIFYYPPKNLVATISDKKRDWILDHLYVDGVYEKSCQ